jgi:hypothetical protein
MAPISSAGSYLIPAAQPSRSQAERSAPAANVKEIVEDFKVEKNAQKESPLQRVNDDQGRRSSEQENAISENSPSPTVAQAENDKSVGEQQKIEAAQQEAQRAEFNQQAGIVRETEPNDVRPPSNTSNPVSASASSKTVETLNVQPLQAVQVENPAIDIFVQLQNIDSPPRQGQEVNRFA